MDSSKAIIAAPVKPVAIVQTGSSPTPKAPAPKIAKVTESRYSDIRASNKQSGEAITNSRIEVEQAMAELKRLADNSGRSLGFSHDRAVSGPVITVTDKDTGKVVRQIPTEVVVRVAHSIEQMKGLLFDQSL